MNLRNIYKAGFDKILGSILSESRKFVSYKKHEVSVVLDYSKSHLEFLILTNSFTLCFCIFLYLDI